MIDRIDTLRRLVITQQVRWQRWNLLEALGWSLTAIWAYFLAAVLLDNLAHLPTWGRLGAAAGLFAVLVVFGRRLAGRWQQRHVTEDQIALAMERRADGSVHNRLINSLQIGRETTHENGSLAHALVQENCQHLSQTSLPGAMAVQPAAVWLASAALLTCVAVFGWIWQPQRFVSSAVRILLPFASIDPVYRTRLEVEPGNIEASGDIEIRIRILGELPQELAILLDEQNRRSTQLVAVQDDSVTYTLRNVQRSLVYAVRGGDFTTPYYRIEVPLPAKLQRVGATYRFPEYVGVAEKSVETTGDLEALEGTQARLRFHFDQPSDAVRLLVHQRSADNAAVETNSSAEIRKIDLLAISPTEFASELMLQNVSEYALETRQGSRTPHIGPWYNIRVAIDEPPRVTLTGLPTSGELPIDSAVPIQVEANDDWGLSRSGLFYRRLKSAGTEPLPDDGWIELQTWQHNGDKQSLQTAELTPAAMGVAEGERIEIAARAGDLRPARAEAWITGTAHGILITGDGSQLQVLYEQILRSEAELAALIAVEQKFHATLDVRIRTLDADPAADGNDPQRVQALVMEAAEWSRTQNELRQTAGRVAREMVEQAGSLRLSVGMLADSEMIRAIRTLDSVATRDDAAGRRSALADARATANRTLQSLGEISEQYIRFRKEWELAHMTPFLKMLADRQAGLRDQTVRWNEEQLVPSEAQRASAVRRQKKLSDLCSLASTAFSGLAERAAEAESPLSEAFGEVAEVLEGKDLQQRQQAAQGALSAGKLPAAASEQAEAAAMLNAAYTRLREAQAEAARQLLAAMEQHEESDLAGQADLEKLKEGYSEDMLDEPDGLSLENIMHLAEVAQAKKNGGGDEKPYTNDYLFPDSAVAGLQRPDTGMRQEFKNLSLATAPGKTPSFPSQSDRKHNRVKPHIQEKFEDLVGALLEEEDEMKANYETFNLNAAFNINEKGDVGKQGGDLNSTAASAATGNQKPPTTNVGGASRIGRQGARAHGVAVGKESINRRGRDKVQEGQDRVPDQKDTVQETKSDDPQEETSTGVGGRKVESDDAKFSLNDTGEWTGDMIDRMDRPMEKQSIVERQGGKLDASVGEMLRDMTSKQEQIIERLKTIRKDLKNLYLPTEHLDQLLDQLQANLHSLNERPTSDIFRLQQRTLEQARGALQVFHQAHSGFQASLPREQQVRGKVVDTPARSAPPGYEEAVKRYYQKLSAPDRQP